jgi:hypothetical protein
MSLFLVVLTPPIVFIFYISFLPEAVYFFFIDNAYFKVGAEPFYCGFFETLTFFNEMAD